MRWRRERRSQNIEDRRSSPIPGGAAGAGIGGLGLLLVIVAALVMGVDPSELLQGTQVSTGPMAQQSRLPAEEQEKLKDFVSLVLGDTEVTWQSIFHDEGAEYREPTLVLFTGGVESACGVASASVGPFYCPGDQKVYLDLDFFYDLDRRFGAPGDFAQAYVIAHEVGHHVQNLRGTLAQVDAARRRMSQVEANRLLVRLELQADCYAGVWANRAANRDLILDPGDIEEGIGAASAVGDDRLQKRSQGYVVPDSFTHGTSAQRVEWFQRGLETGDPAACDTFSRG